MRKRLANSLAGLQGGQSWVAQRAVFVGSFVSRLVSAWAECKGKIANVLDTQRLITLFPPEQNCPRPNWHLTCQSVMSRRQDPVSLSSSRRRKARAELQLRFAVAVPICNISAVSSIESPPKNLSSTS